jgi:hypothetical protein
MHGLLFAPFDLGRWFVLGFTAWLAGLLSSAGSTGRGVQYVLDGDNDAWDPSDWSGAVEDTVASVMAEAWLFAVALGLLLLAVVLGVVLLWVGSRGQFMFLDNLIHRRTEVSRPWHEFGAQGDGLFVWQVVFSILVTVVLGGLVLLGVLWGGALAAADIPLWPFFVGAGVAGFVIVVTLAYVEFFLLHAVVPVMYHHRCGVLEGWRRFGAVFRREPGHLVLFGLLQAGVAVVAAAVFMIAGVATCCVGLLLMALPFIGTVVTLPLPTFQRYLDLEILAGLEADWDLLSPAGSGEVQGDGAVVRTEDVGPDAGGPQPGPEDA